MRWRADIHFGFWLVFRREFGWFRRRPFLLSLTTIAPLILMAVLTVVFSAGLATKLPIAVLDLDGTTLSRSITRMVDAAPEVVVTTPVSDLATGRRLIQSGAIHGLLMLPRNLERDVASARRPDVVFFFNTQTLTTGNLLLRGVQAAILSAEADIRIALRASNGHPVDIAEAQIRPIPVQANALFNPALNYVYFLLAALLPAVLQTIIVTTSAYSVGFDFATRHRLRIVKRLGNGLWPAIAGKMLPYTIIFLAVLGVSDAALFGLLGLPLRGHRCLLIFAGVPFILCCQFLGALLALMLRPLASAVSIVTVLTAPAFGYIGVGFPRIAMNIFAYYWGALLPGTWYLMARIDQTVRGTPVDLSWRPILSLLVILIVLVGLTALRLENIRIKREKKQRAATLQIGPATI